MDNRILGYVRLFEQFINGMISVDVFITIFLERFKGEEQLDVSLFLVLDELFGDVDSFTTDAQLLAERPDFYLDEARLRERVQITMDRLLGTKS